MPNPITSSPFSTYQTTQASKPVNYSALRQQKRVDLTKEVPLNGPLSIYLETTNICNFRCSFCPESFDNYKEKAGGLFQMQMDDFVRIADQIKAFNTVKTLNLYLMGEPFVNKNLTDFIAYSKQHKIAEKISVTSNGTLIKPEKYHNIIESGLDYLRISIYGGDQASHQLRTQNKISLARIKNNILGLREFRDSHRSAVPYLYIKMIESPDVRENERFLVEFKEVGDEVILEPVMNWNDPTEGNLSGLDSVTRLESHYFSKKKEVCPFPFYTLVIHSDLNVSVCCVDWDKQTVVGSLVKNSLQEIWKGSELRNFQLQHLKRRKSELNGCKSCTYLYTAPDCIDALTAAEFLGRC